MRNRYVKRCKCEALPVIVKKVDILRKGVLDIEIEVLCKKCKRPYKEVIGKKTRMLNPKIVSETVKLPKVFEVVVDPQSIFTDTKKSDTGEVDGLDNNGSDNIETGESKEVSSQEEKPIGASPVNPAPEVKSEEEKRDSDEAGSPDPVEKTPAGRSDRPSSHEDGIGSVDLAERSMGDSLEDNGVPLSDILA